MIKPHTTIEPLREDLERLVPDSFLTTTEYKRWLVANNLQELWAKCELKTKAGVEVPEK